MWFWFEDTLSYLWPMALHAYIGWVQVGGAWVLCVLHSHVSLCMACLLFTCLPLPVGLFGLTVRFCCLFLTLCGMGSLGFHSLHLISSLGWVLLGHGPFLPQFGLCFLLLLVYGSANIFATHCLAVLGLLWACHVFIFSLLSLCCSILLLGWFSYHLGHPWPILILWVSLTRFIPLGILSPFHSYIPMGFLLNLLDFADPISISFTFVICWLLHQPPLLIPFFGLLWPILTCFLFLTIPMGLLLLSLGLPWAHLLSLGAFLLFYRSVYHCSCHLCLMVFLFLLILLSSSFVILLGFFLPLAFFFFSPKWTSTTTTFRYGDLRELHIFMFCIMNLNQKKLKWTANYKARSI